MLLWEDLCNQSPGFSALVLQEKTPSPLPVGCLTDVLPELSQEHCLVKTPGNGVLLLLSAKGGPALSGSPFRLGVPYQSCMLAPLPEVHASGYPGPDFTGVADAQRLCKNNVDEDKGYLRVPAP